MKLNVLSILHRVPISRKLEDENIFFQTKCSRLSYFLAQIFVVVYRMTCTVNFPDFNPKILKNIFILFLFSERSDENQSIDRN